MKFITIGPFHYSLNQIACFWHANGRLFIQLAGTTEKSQLDALPDPYRDYYKKLCDATGVIPAEVSE